MESHRSIIRRMMVALFLVVFSTDSTWATDTPPVRVAVETNGNRCEDNIEGGAQIDPKLDVPFFHTTTTSYHWEIVEHEDGRLENSAGGQITAEDLLRIEHAADCTSTHQGKHAMKFCDAVATKDGAKLTIWGGLPAYASDLIVILDQKLGFQCAFSAVYPGPKGQLQWKVTKKTLKLKSNKLEAHGRIYGWISVEFEEIDNATKVSRPHKIEGYFKPVIQTMVEGGVPKGE